MRVCVRCRVAKLKFATKDTCHTCYNIVWVNRKLAADPTWRYARHLVHKYGINFDEYMRQFKLQGGRCDLCRRKSLKKLVVDHDHKTGRVRGLLCHPCNVALGLLRESPARIRALAAYIETVG